MISFLFPRFLVFSIYIFTSASFSVAEDSNQCLKDTGKPKLSSGESTSNGICCGPSGCHSERDEACQYLIVEHFDNECGTVYFDVDKLSTCLINHESDDLLIKNGKRRVDLKIPDDKIPALAFNGKYDPCAKHDSCEEITTYVCELYQNAVKPCQN